MVLDFPSFRTPRVSSISWKLAGRNFGEERWLQGTFDRYARTVGNGTGCTTNNLVEVAHRAGLAAIGPGKQFSDFHTAALEVIATGLHDWGMLPVSVDEALSRQGNTIAATSCAESGITMGLTFTTVCDSKTTYRRRQQEQKYSPKLCR